MDDRGSGPPVPQKNASKAPAVWVPVGWLPNVGTGGTDGVVIFQHEGWCYQLDPEDAPTTKPANAHVVFPVAEFPDCDNCLCVQEFFEGPPGVKCHPCNWLPPGAVDLWVPADQLPALTTPPTSLDPCPPTEPEDFIYFLYQGSCWYLDPGERPQAIPLGATVIALPSKQYTTCFECVTANQPPRIIGYPATPCPDQDGAPTINVLAAAYPEHSTFYFVYGGFCYSFNTDDLQVIPNGINPSAFYADCDSCITDNPPGGGGGGGGDPPGGGGGGGGTPPDDPTKNGLRLWTCAGDGSDGVGGGTPTDMCVLKSQGLAGKIILVDGVCYRVSAQQVDCGGPLDFDQVYSLCTTCVADQKCYRLKFCDDDSDSDLYISIFKWAQNGGGGKPVMKIDGVCYYADTSTKYSPAGKTLVNPTASDRYRTCTDCATCTVDVWRAFWNCDLERWETISAGTAGPEAYWMGADCDLFGLDGTETPWTYVSGGDTQNRCQYLKFLPVGSSAPSWPTSHADCPCNTCPSDCSSCPDLNLTVSGLSSGVCPATLNGTTTLTRSGCTWSGTKVNGGGADITYTLTCTTDGMWRLSRFNASVVNWVNGSIDLGRTTTGCPPEGTWNWRNDLFGCPGEQEVITISS